MSDGYRKPAAPKSPAPPRGPLVKRAEDPAPPRIETGADPRKKKAFAAQSAAVAAELEAAKRTMAITSRLVGAIVIALVLAALFTLRDHMMGDGGVSLTARGRVSLGLGLAIGPWLLVFGNGGAASPHDTPEWFRWGLGTWTLFAFGAAVTGNLEPWIEALLALTV
jgi:hypothetical protein